MIPRALTPEGVFLVDKPPGPSSFDVVKRLRERYGVRAGHAGTLDPLASGLLLCLLGPSTRLARYLVGLDKRYETEIRLGLRTTTGDGEGEVVTLDLHVGSGTYVRSIADALGGHCRTLRRLEIGPFSVEEADETRLIPPAEALARVGVHA